MVGGQSARSTTVPTAYKEQTNLSVLRHEPQERRKTHRLTVIEGDLKVCEMISMDMPRSFPETILPSRLLPSRMSCFPAATVVPVSLVSCSVKPGGVGTLKLISSNGNNSLEGNPPPREMSPYRRLVSRFHRSNASTLPGFFRYCAAALSTDGCPFFSPKAEHFWITRCLPDGPLLPSRANLKSVNLEPKAFDSGKLTIPSFRLGLSEASLPVIRSEGLCW